MTLDDAIEQHSILLSADLLRLSHSAPARTDARRPIVARDSQLLVHLDRHRPLAVTRSRYHMGLAASTVSEAISRLERFGYVAKGPGAGRDRRVVGRRC